MSNRVYFDWNATTPLRREAKEAMAAAWDLWGNPSSVHAEGREARRWVEEARALVAAAVGARARNVVFTSGGTEANVLALRPGLRVGLGAPVERLVVSAIEHASVAGGRPVSPGGDRHGRGESLRRPGPGAIARSTRRQAAGAGVDYVSQ